MKRLLSLVFHWIGIISFICFGFYGLYEFFFGKYVPPKLKLYVQNKSFPFPYPDHGNRIVTEYLEIGEIVPNCGLDEICAQNHFPIHIQSGKPDPPKVCVGGKYVIHKDINNGGRGLNMVIVDSHRMKPVHARRFDTYRMDSNEMELFLLREVRVGDILIVVTFDEASQKLGQIAKKLLVQLGSGHVQNLQFRSQWYMVAQKGMDGFSPFEEMHHAIGGGSVLINRRFCVPRQIKGRPIVPDPSVYSNDAREAFCKKHEDLQDFCSLEQRSVALKPALLLDRHLVGSAVLHTPILILAGTSLESLSLTLETVLSQAGIQVQYVVVIFNPMTNPHVPELCSLFRIMSLPTNAREQWEVLQYGFDSILSIFPSSSHVIFLEEDLLLSPDFFSLMGSLIPLLKDPSLLAVSAWNPNGFQEVSGRAGVAMRIESFPGLAFAVRTQTITKEILPNIKNCCKKRSWEGWLQEIRFEREIVVPEVSRVLKRPSGHSLDHNDELIAALFHRSRKTNEKTQVSIQDLENLTLENYESHLKQILLSKSNKPFLVTKEELVKCAEAEKADDLWKKNSQADRLKGVTEILLVYKDADTKSLPGLQILSRCFGLFHHKEHRPLGIHKGTLRFSHDGTGVLLVSNASPLYELYNATTVFTLP